MHLGDGYELRPISEAWECARGLHPALPPRCPEHGFAVYVDSGAMYAASVGLFPTTGHQLICEYLCTNPGLPLRARYRAVQHLVHAIITYSVAVEKQPFTLNTVPGMRQMLERMGIGGAVRGMDVLTVASWP